MRERKKEYKYAEDLKGRTVFKGNKKGSNFWRVQVEAERKVPASRFAFATFEGRVWSRLLIGLANHSLCRQESKAEECKFPHPFVGQCIHVFGFMIESVLTKSLFALK